MDTSKLILEVDSNKFHDTYVYFLRKLYDDQFIKNHHVMIDNPVSFKRTFAKKAGIKDIDKRSEHSVFTQKDMEAIVEDTNDKYEESATGKYSESLAKRQMKRYHVVSRVLKHTLTELGFEEAANKLLYADESEKEKVKLPQEDDKHKQEVEELNKYIDILKTSVKNLDAKLSTVETSDILSKEEKIKYLELQEELQRAVESAEKCVKDKDYAEAKELQDFIVAATDILKRLQKLQDKPEEKVVEEPAPSPPVKGKETVPVVESKEQYQLPLNNSVAALIPLMTEELKKFLQRCAVKISEDETTIAELTEQITNLYSVIEIGDEIIERLITESQTSKLPEDEEELYTLAKQAVEKISNKDKIKDLVMTGMKKI